MPMLWLVDTIAFEVAIFEFSFAVSGSNCAEFACHTLRLQLIWSNAESDFIYAAISWLILIRYLYFQICFTILNFLNNNFVWHLMFFLILFTGGGILVFCIFTKKEMEISHKPAPGFYFRCSPLWHPFSCSVLSVSLAKDRRHSYSGSPVSPVRSVSKFSHLNGSGWCLKLCSIRTAASVVQKPHSLWKIGNFSLSKSAANRL